MDRPGFKKRGRGTGGGGDSFGGRNPKKMWTPEVPTKKNSELGK
jgi:hypothetical protein